MKKSFLRSFAVLSVMAGAVQVVNCNAAFNGNYWDPQGGIGTANLVNYTGNMSGTWESSTWITNCYGGNVNLPYTEGIAVCFAYGSGKSTPPFVVTANSNHTFAGVFIGPEGPDSCNVTINGPGILTLANGAQGFSMITSGDGANAFLTISNTIAGTGEIATEGFGQFFLYGTNTFSGGITLGYVGLPAWTGLVNFNNSASFGTGSIYFSNGAGSALINQSASSVTIANPVTIAQTGNLNIVPGPGGTVFTGNWNLLTHPLGLGCGSGAGSNLTISGNISGTGAINKWNAGNLFLSGANTFTGGASVTNGTLSVNAIADSGASAIGPSGTVNLAGGTFQYTGAAAASTTRTFQSPTGSNSTIDLPAGSLTLSLLKGSGSFTVNKTGAGTLILGGSSDNSFTAVNVKAGTLVLNKASGPSAHALGGVSTISSGGAIQLSGTGGYQIFSGAGITVNSGGVFDLGGITETNMGTLNLSGNGAGSGALINSSATPAALTPGAITLSANSTVGGIGNITLLKPIGGSGGLTLAGAGTTLSLTNANSYTGSTIISSGTLALLNNSTIANSPSISIAAGTTFDVSATSAYNFSTTNTLTASGIGTAPASAAVINGAGGGTVNLGSQAIALNFTPATSAGDIADPALYVAQGTLVLNGNTIAVNNQSATPLGVGAYTLIQAASPIAGGPNSTVAVTGTGLAAGATASVWASGNNVMLIVGPTPTPAITSVGLSASTLRLNATNGLPYGISLLLESTNLTLPLSQWTRIATNSFDATGSLNLSTTIVNPADQQEYFNIQAP